MMQCELNTWRSRLMAKFRSVSKILHSRRFNQDRRQQMNTLINYFQMVLVDVKYQVMQQSLSTVEILIHPMTVFQIRIAFWVVG